MPRTFKLQTKYYDERKIYKKASIEIQDGITILIGCNGSGKTTLLNEIKDQLRMQHIPVLKYDNLTQGGQEAKSDSIFHNDLHLFSDLWSASEGEAITINLLNYMKSIKYFMLNGEKEPSKLELLFRDNVNPPQISSNERWLLFDAIDSGLSVDQVIDVKNYLLHALLEVYKDYELYILVVANEYEMCCNENCFNVIDGKYVSIKSYDDYRREILKTREYKNIQISKFRNIDNKNERGS